MTQFLLIFNIFLVLFLHFDRSASESGAFGLNDRSLELSLRQERLDAGVCEGESDDENNEEWDLCYSDTRITPSRESHCMCDESCGLYKDCCSDEAFRSNLFIDKPRSDSCIELYSNGYPMAAVYGIDRCDDNWDDTNKGIRDKCELDAEQFLSSGNSYSYLQDIPVLSEKFMYRNVFCAVCNRDSKNLKVWNITIDCDGYQMQDILKDVERQMSPQNYNPLTKKWTVLLNESLNETIECSLGVRQFIDKDFIKDNNLRKCKKTIDECPQSWSTETISIQCKAYASYVFEDNKAYKNYHCALCNGAPIDYIKCFPNTTIWSRDASRSTLWFPLLLDFNFAGDKGEWIGGQHKCPQRGQLYDPLYNKCVSVKCVNSAEEECISKGVSGCNPIIFEEKKDFVILKNTLFGEQIYINHTKSLLNETNYEIFVENNVTKLKLCRNESQLVTDSLTQSPFDVSYGQILLSEISLYVSIVCLALHLIIYTIVPKLRNLPGKNLMSLSGALLLGHISFAIASYLSADRKIVCVLIAITTHYSYLAAFFWMSIMAFDVCKTFRRTKGRRTKSSSRYKYLKYSLYGWLLPAFIVLVSAAFDIALEGSKYRPLYGYRFCWISQRQALLVFFAAPAFAIVCVNVILFSLTAKSLIQTKEQTKILQKKSDKIRYFLYIKLALIMGLTWLFGFAASLTDWNFLWYPFIVLNGLQGAAIFLSFSCKRKVFNLLAKRFGLKPKYQMSTTLTTSDVVRSATGTSLQTSSLVPNSPDSNVTKLNFTKF